MVLGNHSLRGTIFRTFRVMFAVSNSVVCEAYRKNSEKEKESFVR